MPAPSHHYDLPRPGLSRRGLMRGLAWSAPVILVAATAPAASASGGNFDIHWGPVKVSNSSDLANVWGGIEGNLKVLMKGSGSLEPLHVTITVDSSLKLTGDLNGVDISGSGEWWSKVSVSEGDTHTVYHFVWTGPDKPNSFPLVFSIPTTIVDGNADVFIPTPVTFYADSSEVTSSITTSATVG